MLPAEVPQFLAQARQERGRRGDGLGRQQSDSPDRTALGGPPGGGAEGGSAADERDDLPPPDERLVHAVIPYAAAWVRVTCARVIKLSGFSERPKTASPPAVMRMASD